MTEVSDDGFWKLENGAWVPTEKQTQALAGGTTQFSPPIMQPSLIATDLQTNIQFVPKKQTMTHDEISTNTTADENIPLTGLTTTRTHTDAVKKYLGNPFYQSFLSRSIFDGIQEPGEKKMKQKLLKIHDSVERAARSKFNSGDMSHNAEQIIEKMYLEGEYITHKWPLQIRKVEILQPSNQSKDDFSNIENTNHFGVRAILTTDRILLIDSTEDSVTELANPSTKYAKLPLQRKQSGIFQISHEIMHDFWFKSISLSDVSGSEFHFSHFSKSSKQVRRFHHFASLIPLFCAFLLAALSFTSFAASDMSDEKLDKYLITNTYVLILAIVGFIIYHYASTMKQYMTQSSFGKERIIKIGYFDKIHDKQLLLKLQLEDSQTIDKAIDWIQLLESSCNKIE